jgi:hypothetical protein
VVALLAPAIVAILAIPVATRFCDGTPRRDGEHSNVGAAGEHESQRGGEKPPDASGEDETECNKAARRGGLRRDGIAEVSHPSHVP